MPYSFEKPTCPRCSEPPEGTVEAVSGLAELDQVGDGLFEYGGHTEIHWDGQRTVSWSRRLVVATPTARRRLARPSTANRRATTSRTR